MPISELSYDRRGCPVCGGPRAAIVFRQRFEVVASAPLKGYDVAVCDECGMGYADRLPPQSQFDAYYREMSKYEYHQRGGEESADDRARLRAVADHIARVLPTRDARVLDVGCASGRVLSELRERGWRDVRGLDPSPFCASTAKRLYDIAVRDLTLAQVAQSGERYGLVLLVGVLEHLRDLRESADQLAKVVEPGGVLYLEVPDATTFIKYPNAPYQDFSTEHLNFFGPTSLDNALGPAGFRRIHQEQNARIQADKSWLSNISAAYRLAPSEPWTRTRDTQTIVGLERYVEACGAEEHRLEQLMKELAKSRRSILVWGVGTHTGRLLATTELAKANIAGFIESNARYHGKQLHGLPILAPEVVKTRSEPILVSSRVFQREISEQIRRDLGAKNELILLYPES